MGYAAWWLVSTNGKRPDLATIEGRKATETTGVVWLTEANSRQIFPSASPFR
jgi:hypothetical protein